MAEHRAEALDEDPPLSPGEGDAALGASRLPAGLSGAWPVPRTAVLGTRAGALAQAESALLRGVLAVLARLPEPAQRRVIDALARLARRVDRRHSDSARGFLRQAFGAELGPAELESRVLQAWRHFFRMAISSTAFERNVPLASIRDHYDVHMTDAVRAVLARGSGCVVVAAHVGDWEAGSAVLPWLGFDPIYAIAKPARNRPLSVHMQRLREARGIRLLPRRGAMRHAATIIASGGTLVMMLDQRTRTRPMLVPFFGRLARCDRSAGVLLRRLACPVVISACYLTARPYHYELVFPAVLWPADVAGRSPEEIAQRVNAEFEAMIRTHPEQYLWLHDRYRGAPSA